MGNGLDLGISVSTIAVFAQGLISFFSPCVLPLLPMYIGYLAGGTGTKNENGDIVYKKSKVIVNTLFFIIGISFAFMLLGFAATKLGGFFQGNRMLFIRGGGILIILFGLFQMGLFESRTLNSEKRFHLPVNKLTANPLVAFILGFTFSFAWTPCVGPMLTSVLLMSGTASTAAKGFVLIGVYTLGFVIPFMLTGIFTTSLLKFFRAHSSVVKYAKKIGGILMIIIGLVMVTGFMNDVSGYLSQDVKKISRTEEKTDEQKKTDPKAIEEDDKTGTETQTTEAKKEADRVKDEEKSEGKENTDSKDQNDESMPAPDFELTDQYGNTHKLSDYKGKTVLINFWATWCPPCRAELPDIQEAFEENGKNEEDVIILGITAPGTGGEKDDKGIMDFLEENHITYPVLFDYEGASFMDYYVSAFPTTYMIGKDGNVFGYLTGGMTKSVIDDIIKQTKEAK